MAHEQFLSASADIKWLKETHLKDILHAVPKFKSFVLSGHESGPDKIVLYWDKNPNHDDAPMATILFDSEGDAYIEDDKPEPKRLSNTDIIERIMSYGNPMKQIIVMTAIEKYPQMCIEAGADVFESGLISGDAWIRSCKEILRELEELRGR